MKYFILIFINTLILLFFSCKKESNYSETGYIKAEIDGVQYDFNYVYKSPTYGGLFDYSVTYSKEDSQTPTNIFIIQFVRTDQLGNLPFTLKNNYDGFGMQVHYKNSIGGNFPNDYSINDFSINNWSQSITNTGFKATITESKNNMLKGTFEGRIRDYNNDGSFRQKTITKGSFNIPYQ